jgi:hypothetical protein
LPIKYFLPFWGLTGQDFGSANLSIAGKFVLAARKNLFRNLFSEITFCLLGFIYRLDETKYNASSPNIGLTQVSTVEKYFSTVENFFSTCR